MPDVTVRFLRPTSNDLATKMPCAKRAVELMSLAEKRNGSERAADGLDLPTAKRKHTKAPIGMQRAREPSGFSQSWRSPKGRSRLQDAGDDMSCPDGWSLERTNSTRVCRRPSVGILCACTKRRLFHSGLFVSRRASSGPSEFRCGAGWRRLDRPPYCVPWVGGIRRSPAEGEGSGRRLEAKSQRERATVKARERQSAFVKGHREWLQTQRFRNVESSMFEQTAREMASSIFCLMPAGDNSMRSLMRADHPFGRSCFFRTHTDWRGIARQVLGHCRGLLAGCHLGRLFAEGPALPRPRAVGGSSRGRAVTQS